MANRPDPYGRRSHDTFLGDQYRHRATGFATGRSCVARGLNGGQCDLPGLFLCADGRRRCRKHAGSDAREERKVRRDN